MTFAVFDFPAIAKLTKAFAEEPPQNEVKPVQETELAQGSHVYGYGEGKDYVYAVYGTGWHRLVNVSRASGFTDTAPCEYSPPDFDPA